jgi:hypothetical protein
MCGSAETAKLGFDGCPQKGSNGLGMMGFGK